MNNLKKAIASITALATVSALGISASAYRNPDFYFNIGGNSGSWSDGEVKEDSLNTAAAHSTEGTVSGSRPVYVTVYSRKTVGNTYRLTTTATLRSNNDNATMTYTDTYSEGANYYLRGETGTYGATVGGYWNP